MPESELGSGSDGGGGGAPIAMIVPVSGVKVWVAAETLPMVACARAGFPKKRKFREIKQAISTDMKRELRFILSTSFATLSRLFHYFFDRIDRI